MISQILIDEIDVNSEDNLPNKIKEKADSLLNTKNKHFVIPMKKDTYVSTKTENQSYEYESTGNAKSENSNIQEDKNTEEKSFYLIDTNNSNFDDGNNNPINAKEHMIMNMNKKYSKIMKENINNKVEKEEEFADLENTVEENNQVSEASHYGMPANIEKILVNTVDFDTTVVAINQTREKYKNVSEQANKAEHDAEESDKLLEKISNEYTEAERKLKEKELRSKEMEQKILSFLNTEQNRLSQQLQEKEIVINNANKRKEENHDKIVDFKTKISSTLEKSNEYDEMISKQEELLNTLVKFNKNLENKMNSNGENDFRKIA